jgi:riboflavin kinase/FMN adenylyltransferase
LKIHHAVALRNDRPPLVLAIGYFDGVHLGHRALFTRARALCGEGMALGALTFLNHPSEYLRPSEAPRYIMTLEERVNRLAACGIEELYLLPFDARLARTHAAEFLDFYLVEQLRVRVLVVGAGFHFGYAREGDVAFAGARLQPHGILVEDAPQVEYDGERVSSSRIREAIGQGDLEAADAMLAEPYALEGTVTLGRGRGHDLGFPTANLRVHPRKALPREGVYRTYVRHDGTDYPALLSLGTNPTFGGKACTVEVWIDHFDRAIYGESLRLHHLRFLREQERFESTRELIAAMERDRNALRGGFP